MRCKNCDYPIFRYARCCPMCGKTVETQVVSIIQERGPQTRIEFWLAHLRRVIGQTRPWRATPS